MARPWANSCELPRPVRASSSCNSPSNGPGSSSGSLCSKGRCNGSAKPKESARFADARSIAPDDLIAQDLIFPHRRGEIYMLAHNPTQRWLSVPDLAPDEAVLIKCWDSDEGVARFTPHTAYEDPTTPPGTPPRESIEFRTIAFW